jgi:hypothetical protein
MRDQSLNHLLSNVQVRVADLPERGNAQNRGVGFDIAQAPLLRRRETVRPAGVRRALLLYFADSMDRGRAAGTWTRRLSAFPFIPERSGQPFRRRTKCQDDRRG